MSHFQITGGVPLCGEVRCGGSKNAALPIMAAAILASEPVRLEGAPRLTDVRIMSRLLDALGVNVSNVNGRMVLETVDPTPIRAPQRLVRRMRAGFCVLGPLLARRGKAVVPLPGGCNIGHRPVDLHLKGLAALGADLRLQHGYVVATARRLRGATIELAGPNGPTVTGTANVLCAAVLARGLTIIRHAALEPEIADLAKFLTALGARIEGAGTPTLRIDGVEQLGGAVHRLIPDRIEAGTLLIAAAVTGGSATVRGVVPEHLDAVLQKLREAGAEIEIGGDWIAIRAAKRSTAVSVVAQPYPGFPTDLQAQWTALAAVSEGTLQRRGPRLSRPLHACCRTEPPGRRHHLRRRRGDDHRRPAPQRRGGNGPRPPRRRGAAAGRLGDGRPHHDRRHPSHRSRLPALRRQTAATRRRIERVENSAAWKPGLNVLERSRHECRG